jgi:hypothetical protein
MILAALDVSGVIIGFPTVSDDPELKHIVHPVPIIDAVSKAICYCISVAHLTEILVNN